MIAPLVALALAPAEPQQLSPRLDQPYRYVSEEVREVAGRPCRFTAERHLVFRRDPAGLIAEVTLERLSTDAGGGIAARFLAGSGGLRGRIVRFHLAATGAVTAIDDQPAVWAAVVAGFAAMPPVRNPATPRNAISHDPAAIFARFPPERQQSMLATAVAGVLTDPATLALPGRLAVTLPGQGLSGDAVAEPLAGEQLVDRTPEGLWRATTRAQGPDVILTRTRVLDPASGLLVSEEQVTERTVADRRQTTRSTRALTLMVR